MTEATLIGGKAVASAIEEEVGAGAKAFLERHGRKPGLSVILVGDNPASKAYVGGKMRASERTGIESRTINLPDSIDQESLHQEIEKWSACSDGCPL